MKTLRATQGTATQCNTLQHTATQRATQGTYAMTIELSRLENFRDSGSTKLTVQLNVMTILLTFETFEKRLF